MAVDTLSFDLTRELGVTNPEPIVIEKIPVQHQAGIIGRVYKIRAEPGFEGITNPDTSGFSFRDVLILPAGRRGGGRGKTAAALHRNVAMRMPGGGAREDQTGNRSVVVKQIRELDVFSFNQSEKRKSFHSTNA